jgi:hypothetical protein
MASTLSPPIQPEFSEDRWVPSHPVDLDFDHGPPARKRPSLAKRVVRAVVRVTLTLGVGVVGTLAWQSYGDAARQTIASSFPQLAWLAPQATSLTKTAPDTPALPALSPELLQLKAMAAGFNALQQSVDRLAGQVAAGQQQTARDIAKLQAADQDLVQKLSAAAPHPAAPVARKPVARPIPLSSSEEPPVR